MVVNKAERCAGEQLCFSFDDILEEHTGLVVKRLKYAKKEQESGPFNLSESVLCSSALPTNPSPNI